MPEVAPLHVQQLIDRFGRPPPAVCLDWAWQVCEMCAQDPSEGFARRMQWSQLQVDHDGLLKVTTSRETEDDHAAGPTANALIHTLIDWSRVPSAPRATASQSRSDGPGDSACLERLRLATRHLSATCSAQRPTKTRVERASGHSVAGLPVRASESTSNATPALRSRRLQRRFTRVATLVLGTTLLLGATLLLVVVGVRFANSNRDSAQRPDRSGSSSAGRTAAMSESARLTQPNATPLMTVDHQVDTQALPPLAAFPSTADTSSLNSLVETLPPVPDPGESSVASGSGEMSTEADELGDRSDVAGSERGTTEMLAESADIDVLREIRELAGTDDPIAIQDEPVTQLTTPQPPMELASFPMRTVYRVRVPGRGRWRQPAWVLQLEPPSGFRVEPNGPQVVSGEATARWSLALAEHDALGVDTSPQIRIETRLRSKHDPSLTWQVCGVAEQLPGIAWPLQIVRLEGLRRHLNASHASLQWQRDQLGQLGRRRLTAEQRNLLRRQREWLDQQLDVAEQATSIVVATQRLVEWIDGRLVLHAELRELEEMDSPPLLQFGDLAGLADDTSPANP